MKILATLALVAASLPVLPASAAAAGDSGAVALDKIHPSVAAELDSPAEKVEALVVLDARPDLGRVRPREVPAALAAAAEASQAPVADTVRDAGGEVLGSFWLQNMVLVRAGEAAFAELTRSDVVDRIIPNLEVRLSEEDSGPATLGERPATWGVERIGADAVHDELGITGEGVRIAVLDTGVDIGHPDLAGKLVTDDPSDPNHPGGWIEFDPSGAPVASPPRDTSYHGTHVAGTAVGGDASGTRIGVAPGAELMAALVIPGGSGTFAQVIAGMQWALDPVDADGNPAGEPADVVNLSLGGCGLSQEMIEPTRNLRAAGIFPAFAIGNDDPFNCPSCGPVGSASPGNVYEAVGVGATDIADNVDDRSCGAVLDTADWANPPAEWPEQYVKPDLSAPGVDVESADPGGGYRRISGTSMATPHVAGAAALIYQAEAGIGVDRALEILTGTSYFDERYGAQRPNPRFGAGRINAYDAVTEAMLRSGISGVVTEAGTGTPVGGARVRLDTGRSAVTGPDGAFELRLPAGTYTVEVSQFGYEPLAVDGIVVTGDGYTTVDPQLIPNPRGQITGTVTYGPTGSTVPGASVRVLDVPLDFTATTDGKGRYTIEGVPAGDYRVVAATPDRARSEPAAVTVPDGVVTADLNLARPPATERVSNAGTGAQGNGTSWWPSITADGRYVAFGSTSDNLVAGDTNGDWDLFLTDRLTGLVERVSVAHDGGEADGFSLQPKLSPDGRHLGFNSGASNLVEGDTNEVTDAFVRDLLQGTTERVSVAYDGGEADGGSGGPALSADGRYAAFGSDAANLVEADTNDRHDVFVRDRDTGTTERISVGYDGSEADNQSRDPSISADGRYVAFHSDATNLVPDDTNGRTDVFVYDRETGDTVRIAGPGEGDSRDPKISADGRVVVYNNRPTRFGRSQLYTHDLVTGQTEHISVAVDGGPAEFSTSSANLSADGNLVVFYSGASNLVEGDTNGRDDIFVRDRSAGTTERVSLTPDGQEADDRSALPVMSPDGRYVAYQSNATDLVGGDTNGRPDVFVYDRDPAQPQARFAVWDLEIRQPMANPRQPVAVMVKVKNIGDTAGAYDAVLRVDGAVVDTVTVQLRPDTWRWARFWVSRTEPGDYQIAIGPTGGQLTVRAR